MRATEERDHFVRAAFSAELVRRAGEALRPAGIPVMPLKGVLLQKRVYADPANRPATDVDLLVPEERFEEAAARLVAAGFCLAWVDPAGRERVFRLPGGGPRLDLHRRVFPDGQFRLPTAELFARGAPDQTAFGTPVVLPDPYDLYVHLLGHFCVTFLCWHTAHHPEDLALTARRFGLDAAACARRLGECRLRRAARWGLPLADQAAPDPFHRAVLRALGEDPIGDALARAVRLVVPRLKPGSLLGKVPPNLLHRSPGAVLGVLLRVVGDRLGRGPRSAP